MSGDQLGIRSCQLPCYGLEWLPEVSPSGILCGRPFQVSAWAGESVDVLKDLAVNNSVKNWALYELLFKNLLPVGPPTQLRWYCTPSSPGIESSLKPGENKDWDINLPLSGQDHTRCCRTPTPPFDKLARIRPWIYHTQVELTPLETGQDEEK